MDERPTTVLLTDHKTMFREGLAELLTSYGTSSDVLGETTNDEEPLVLDARSKGAASPAARLISS